MAQLQELIELVKQHPPLYDNNDPQFKMMVVREAAWTDIAEQLGISVNVAKNKWKNLRDSHAKYLKATHAPGGVPPNLFKYRHWQWADAMQWLTAFTCTWRPAEETELPPAPPRESEDDKPRAAPRVSWTEKRKRKARIVHHHQVKRNPCQRVTDNLARCRQNLDATEHIFIGYAKMLKSFSRRRQAMVKMKIAQLMLEHELEHIRESSSEGAVRGEGAVLVRDEDPGVATDPLDGFDDQTPLSFKHEPMEAAETSE